MKAIEKFKNLVGIEDEYEYEDDYMDDDYEESAPYERPSRYSRSSRDNLVPMSRPVGDMKMVLVEPESFDKAQSWVDSLKEKRPIIVNLEKLDHDTARKIFDFLNGATYALGGQVQKISTNIFVFVPSNVDIDSTAVEQNVGYNDNCWK